MASDWTAGGGKVGERAIHIVLHTGFIVKRYFFYVFHKIFLAYQKKVVFLRSRKGDKPMAKKAAITRIRTLYAIFIGVIALCIGLFFFNIINPADPLLNVQIDGQKKDYGVIITDLNSSSELYRQSHAVEGLPEGMDATATVRTFDVNITSDDSQRLSSSKAKWCMWLQVFCVLAGIAMTIVVVMALISFYINVRKGKVFPKKNIAWLVWAGVLMIVMSLGMDVSTYLERTLALDLLAGSSWEPQVTVQIHHTRIVFGLTIIFMAEIFKIGREMQEEQELTI